METRTRRTVRDVPCIRQLRQASLGWPWSAGVRLCRQGGVCCGLVTQGALWHGRRGETRLVQARRGTARSGEAGMVLHVMSRRGLFRFGRRGEFWYGQAARGWVWRGLAWQGRQGRAWLGKECQCVVRHGRRGLLWRSEAGHGMARQAKPKGAKEWFIHGKKALGTRPTRI